MLVSLEIRRVCPPGMLTEENLMNLRVALGFARFPDGDLDNFALAVIKGINGKAAYPTPPVSLTDVQAAVDDFVTKVARSKTGGMMDTAAKNNSRETLIGMLRQLAHYVQLNCNNDLTTLLSSGFQAMSTNRSASPLEQPQGLVLRNGSSGQLIAKVSPVRNTRMYEGRIKVSEGDWLPSVFSGDSQRITFEGLEPGTLYTCQVRALGGSTGQSDWSDPSSHRAM
jgi:hypothetical protein